MDAQQRRKGASQYGLQGQWQPTDEQPYRNAAGDRAPVARQPRLGNSAEYVAGTFHNTPSNGRGYTRIEFVQLVLKFVQLIQRSL